MGLSHSPRIVTDGLVFCVDAANKRSYPGAGTAWTDLTANKNNGTLTNGPTFDTNNKGGIVLDGTNDFIACSNTSLSVQCPLTIDVWAKYIGGLGIENLVALKSGSKALQFGTRTSGVVWRYGAGINISYTTPTLGKITHWILTADGSNMNVYIDGLLDSSTTSAANQTGSNALLSIGTYGNSGSEVFGGTVYCVKLYNKVLTANEVLQNHLATRGRYT